MMGRKLLLSCFYSFFCCGIVMLTMGSALPDISAHHGLAYSVSGAMLSAFSLGNLASGILSSLAVIYLGPKAAIVILTLCVCAGMSMLATVNAHALMFIACALAGLGRGSMITFSQANVSLITRGSPTATTMLHATFAVGAIVAPLMFSALRVIDWRIGLCVVAVMCAISAMMFAFRNEYPESEKKSGKSLEFLRDKGFILLCGLIFLYLCCEFAVNGWLVTYMTHKEMPMNFAHGMAALLWVVMLAGRLACAWLSKYVSMKKLLIISSLGAAIFFGAMLFARGGTAIAFSVGSLGLCMAGISPIIYASSAPYTNKYSMAMGILFTAGCVGGTLMPLLTGIIAERFGFDGGMGLVLCAFVLLVALSAVNLNWRHEQ